MAIYTRAQQKHDIEANWIKAINFIPLEGEIIIYDADENYSYQRIKIGDGKTKVNDLPFDNIQGDWNQDPSTLVQKHLGISGIYSYGFTRIVCNQ